MLSKINLIANQLYRQLSSATPPPAAIIQSLVGTAEIGPNKTVDMWLMANGTVSLSNTEGSEYLGTIENFDNLRLKNLLVGLQDGSISMPEHNSEESLQNSYIRILPQIAWGLPRALGDWDKQINLQFKKNLGLKVIDIARQNKALWLVNVKDGQNNSHLFDIKYDPARSGWHYQVSENGTDFSDQFNPNTKEIAHAIAVRVAGKRIGHLQWHSLPQQRYPTAGRGYRGALSALRFMAKS